MEPNEFQMDPDKTKAIEMFIRRGGSRRQDHGDRRCMPKGQRWFDRGYFNKDEPRRQNCRRVFKRGGVIED